MQKPALFNWCEPDYVGGSVVAEWHNTWSNLAFVVVGVATVWLSRSDPAIKPLRLPGWMLVLIGFGSMYFHGTLTRWGQAADELMILWWEVAVLLTLFRSRTVGVCWCWGAGAEAGAGAARWCGW